LQLVSCFFVKDQMEFKIDYDQFEQNGNIAVRKNMSLLWQRHTATAVGYQYNSFLMLLQLDKYHLVAFSYY